MSDDFSTGRLVAVGVACAVVFGVTMGLVLQNVWAGIIAGPLFGLSMAIVMRHQWGSTALRGLSRAERKQVWQTLKRGEAVGDRRLAAPALKQAKVFLAQPLRPRTARICFIVLAVLGVVVAVADVIEDGWTLLPSGVPLTLISLVMLFVAVPLGERQRARVEQSARATTQKWSQSTGD
jgi:hypothetical protein